MASKETVRVQAGELDPPDDEVTAGNRRTPASGDSIELA
jgi:hypothetical protein